MNATPGQESTSCPDGAAKSVSVWHFGFDQHLLTTNSLSISLSIWLHVLDVVRVTRRRKQCFAESQLIFFFQVCQQNESQHSESLLPNSALLRTKPNSHPPGTGNKVHWSGLTVGTMPVQSWAERVCRGQRKQPEMIDPVIHCEAKNDTRWRVRCPNGESMVNRYRKSQLICTCSVVFQSLYFSHIEPLWWSIHWKPCEPRRTGVKNLAVAECTWYKTSVTCSTTCKRKWI